MWKRRIFVAAFCFLIGGVMWSSAAFAQRTDGRSTPAGGDGTSRPTLTGPGGGHNQVGGTPVPGGTLAPARPAGQPTRAPFTPSFQATVAMPFNMPSLNNINTAQLPYDFSLNNLQFDSQQSSPEAYGALVSFAAQHLGISVRPLYAGTIDNAAAVLNSAVFAQIVALFPQEMQEMLTQGNQLDSTPYWGLFPDGVGIVYLVNCVDSPDCTMELENTQVQFANLVMGVYGLYVPGAAPGSEDAALSLIQSTYPGLVNMDFMYLGMAEAGYDFAAIDYTPSRGPAYLKVAWAGTVAYNNQTLVYVFTFVGDGTF